LKKSQALNKEPSFSGLQFAKHKKDAQVSDDPLHDAEVVHHLDECDEEDDGGKDSNEEPMLVPCCLVEEEGTSSLGSPEEVASKSCDPLENRETSAGLEHEERDDLLKEQADNDGRPLKHQFNMDC